MSKKIVRDMSTPEKRKFWEDADGHDSGVILVKEQDFQRDRLRYLRQASPECKVVVQDSSGKVSLVAGGTLGDLHWMDIT